MHRRELLMLGLGLPLAACKRSGEDAPGEVDDGVDLRELNGDEQATLGRWVVGKLQGSDPGELPTVLRETPALAYVALRSAGTLVAESWGGEGTASFSLSGALANLLEAVGEGSYDTIELDLAHRFKTIEAKTEDALWQPLGAKHQGIRGIEIRFGEKIDRNAPTQMLARNHTFRQEIERLWRQFSMKGDEFFEGEGKVRLFEAQQYLIAAPAGTITPLLRGNVLVEPSAVSQANTRACADLMIGWLLTHLHEGGRMTYQWYPATSAEDRGNNMIRQWMASNALIQIARRRGDSALWDRIAANLDYNLAKFYVEREGFGLIDESGQYKLGAIALAALAIVSHRDRARWAVQEAALRRTVDALWREGGQFESFWRRPSAKDDNTQNFYPGEALLLWATLYAETRDLELLRRYAASFRYYQKFHRDNRRPSLVPWHTQAHVAVWQVLRAAPVDDVLKAEDLAAWVFDMNDWLVETMAVWDVDVAYPDEKGRFYSRKRPELGGPHASSTGVYMEGLIDAHRMAKALGDAARAEVYRRTLARAMRSVMQLQFVDEVDMYYVVDRDKTRGGLRTTECRSEIRVDNVQHVLMAVLEMLEDFGDTDYSTS
ncbi:hypothetical protein ACNOYE_40130 [Nannocystaceae bacterium ST9]